MFKSALNYLGSALEPGSAASASAVSGAQDALCGSVVNVGGIGVLVNNCIGEGGFAFVYKVKRQDNGKQLALKRLMATDQEKKQQIVQEIAFLKGLQQCPYILQFVAAANVPQGKGFSPSKCEEYLLLTELCITSMYHVLVERSGPFPPLTVAQIYFQTCEAVAALHSANPAISHRDLKIENLLVDSTGRLKLCDFGSASTDTYYPDHSWNMSQRTKMEEELAKFTTPMYRAPEMVDEWSNLPVTVASDIWALGCLLFQLCFHFHPFEEGAKLQIVNGKYSIPEKDVTHVMFHDLISQMLVIDPSLRPSITQVQAHLGEIAVGHGWDLEGKLNLELPLPKEGDGSLSGGGSMAPASKMPSSSSSPNLAHSEEKVVAAVSSAVTSSSTNSSAGTLMSSLKGSAGSMFRNIKESSRAVVSTLMASKDIDFHLITTRIAAMSCPSDGLDISNYSNSLDDIRQIMEAQNAGHYTIVNLCERKYAASRFPRGKVFDADWSTIATPSIEQVLEASMKILEFLSANRQNVVAIHCLDGRSNTAALCTALLLITKTFTKVQDCLKYFEMKRCEPVLSCGQRAILRHVEQFLRGSPSIAIPHLTVSINAVIMEPVPLFTKAGDGVRPFMEIYSGSNLVHSTLTDYSSLKTFTPYDEEVVLPLNGSGVKIEGDISIVLYHARQVLGSILGGRLERIRICSISFNPAFLSSSKTHIRFPTHELDGIVEVEKIPGDFSVSVNFTQKENTIRKVSFPYKMPEKRKLDLVFASKAEFQEAVQLIGGGATRQPSSLPDEAPPVRPPREKEKKQSPTEMQAKKVDDTTLLDLNMEATSSSTPSPLTSSESWPPPSNVSSLIDIGKESSHENTEQLATNNAAEGTDVKPLFTLSPSGDDSSLLNLETSPDENSASSSKASNLLSDDLLVNIPSANVGDSSQAAAVKPSNPFSSSQFSSNSGPAQSSDLLGDLLMPSQSGSTNVLPPSMPKSGSEQMIDDMLNQLNIDQPTTHQTAKTQGAAAKPPAKPNYNSAFFQQAPQTQRVSKPASTATFEDLLGGFAPKDDGQGKTIGEMKKAEEKRTMDPDEAKIFEWTHGKSRNLRALLCSLDTVLWKDSRWEKCGMHQLVKYNDVKKMYRRAALAVHPDKQVGSDNERLAKLIFTELNDGWAKFQEEEQQ